MDNLFEKAQSNASKKLDITPEEADRFKKAFQDPEFCKLMEEYVAEMQNPETRAETEAYISQLEGENKVPEGKELIRPAPCFVAKSKKMDQGKEEDKIFINIVESDKIMPPTKNVSPEGQRWSLPYSLGPPHMECDSHKNNVVTFDCCFHPNATKLCEENKRYRDMIINTAIEGIELTYKRQNIITKVSKEYRVLKGFKYKTGQVPTMLVDIASKSTWSADNETVSRAESVKTPAKTEKITGSTTSTSAEPAIKKGFLSRSAAKESKEKRKSDESVNTSLVCEVSNTETVSEHATPSVPKYTVTERGQVSVGDFDAVTKHFVSSNRPAELLYKFELPKVLNPSEVHLDVAERLSYHTIYNIALQLPYPVYEKKGSAKYDKINKTLIITLPVQSPPPQAIEFPAAINTVEIVNKEGKIDSSEAVATQIKSGANKGESHTRWVQHVQQNDESQRLRDEIQRKAHEVESEFRDLNFRSVESLQPTPIHCTASHRSPLFQMQSFIGRKDGYVFKNGPRGVGYYLDARDIAAPSIASCSDSISSQESSAQVHESDKFDTAPFDFRQTKEVISIIINVPNIVSSTVQFHCSENDVDIQFEAIKENSKQFYRVGWTVALSLDAKKCTFDIAAKNMAIVLVKRTATYLKSESLLTQRSFTSATPKATAPYSNIPVSSHAKPELTGETLNMRFSTEVGLFDLD